MTFKKRISGPEESNGTKKVKDMLIAGKPPKVEGHAGRQLLLFPEEQKLNWLLIDAAMRGNTEEARKIIAKGADVNARSDEGMTALGEAAAYGYTETARMLINMGADVNAKDNEGMTALMKASANGRTETAKMLISWGADIDARDNEGRTALMIAAKYKNAKTVEMLFVSRAQINDGDFVSHVALPQTYFLGFRPGTALEWADKLGDKKIAQMLRKRAKELKEQNATK